MSVLLNLLGKVWVTFQALLLAWDTVEQGQAYVGREVAGLAKPQSGSPDMRSEQEKMDSAGPVYTDIFTNPFNDLQFPVSQVEQSLVELTLALKDLHKHKHTQEYTSLKYNNHTPFSHLFPQQQ